MTPRRDIRSPQHRALRGPLGVLLAIVIFAVTATLTGCAASGGTVPGCGDPLRLAIIAQSVPGASYVPCISGLAPGWNTSGFAPTQDGTSFLLNSDRSPGQPVTVRLIATCNVSGASPSPPRAPGVLTYTRLDSITPRFAGTLYERIPGRLHKLPVRLRPGLADRVGGTIRAGHRPVSQAAAAAHPETGTRRGAQPMTPVSGAADQAGISTPALRFPLRGRKRSLADALADPRVRLGAGTGALLVTAIAARRDVGRSEAAAFRAVNGLPGWLYPPAWAVMQLGTLGAAPAAAGVAWLAEDRELAGRLLAGGAGTWALSKVFKQVVRRPGGGPAPGDSRPRSRGRRARVPVRARRRRRRLGRRRLPSSRQGRSRHHPERRSRRGPDPDLCRGPSPARCRGRRGARIRHRGGAGPRPPTSLPSATPRTVG